MAGYDSFAADYHWLLDDEELSGRPFVAAYEHYVTRLRPGSKVLDAACGIGVEALALARRSLQVRGTDASPSMVAEARRRASTEGLVVDFSTSTWAELPERCDDRFELVVCNGNALVHANDPGSGGLEKALRGLSAVTTPTGRVIIGTRDFELLRSGQPDVEVAGQSVVRDGTECVRFYSWTIPTSWTELHQASVHLALITDGTVEHRRHDVSFRPYTWDQLRAAIAVSGLDIEWSTRTSRAPRYTLALTVGSAER